VLGTPVTHFALVGDDRVAYQVLGEGPRSLLFSAGSAGNVDIWWEDPDTARLLRTLSRMCRLILVDRRGAGSSDPLPDNVPGWEVWVEDFEVVMDEVGVQSVTLFAGVDAGAIGVLMAATRPERLDALILVNTTARLLIDDDYPIGFTSETFEAFRLRIDEHWGTEELARTFNPDCADDERFIRWYARYMRAAGNRKSVLRLTKMWADIDVREYLPLISVPVLVISRDHQMLGREHGQYLAENIPTARLVQLAGKGGILGPGATDLLGPLQELLQEAPPETSVNRVLSTVVFTDIVDSTKSLAKVGDQAWRTLLDGYEAIAGEVLGRHGGRLIKSTGDGSLMTFESPTRALRATREIQQAARTYGLSLRAGSHTGEIELRGDDIGGVAVHVAARISGSALGDELLVSRTTKDLVEGSQTFFESAGTRMLKGFDEPFELFSVVGA